MQDQQLEQYNQQYDQYDQISRFDDPNPHSSHLDHHMNNNMSPPGTMAQHGIAMMSQEEQFIEGGSDIPKANEVIFLLTCASTILFSSLGVANWVFFAQAPVVSPECLHLKHAIFFYAISLTTLMVGGAISLRCLISMNPSTRNMAFIFNVALWLFWFGSLIAVTIYFGQSFDCRDSSDDALRIWNLVLIDIIIGWLAPVVMPCVMFFTYKFYGRISQTTYTELSRY